MVPSSGECCSAQSLAAPEGYDGAHTIFPRMEGSSWRNDGVVSEEEDAGVANVRGRIVLIVDC